MLVSVTSDVPMVSHHCVKMASNHLWIKWALLQRSSATNEQWFSSKRSASLKERPVTCTPLTIKSKEIDVICCLTQQPSSAERGPVEVILNACIKLPDSWKSKDPYTVILKLIMPFSSHENGEWSQSWKSDQGVKRHIPTKGELTALLARQPHH